jgi:hypothetical protein
MTSVKEQQRRFAATLRAIALLATKEHQPDEIKIEEGDDEKPREDLPQVSRASHYS